MPFNDLNESVVITIAALGEIVREDETTDGVSTLCNVFQLTVRSTRVRVAYQIGPVRVKLTTRVVGLQVEHRLVNERDDLEVGRCAEELNAGDGTGGNETRATSGLGAPRDFLAFRITNGGGTSRRSPNTPVCIVISRTPGRRQAREHTINVVDEAGLALRGGALRG